MLKLTNIKKDYVLNGGDTVPALKGVDLEFRPSEFVSILGPSGCGKTTMLNIIGGLDRYTDGDLSIDGISTKHYSDVDWDAYRNIRIGFIFQSYNLISHVDILTNVEMALLLAGVSKQERRQRAIKALEDVGLGEHIHKKPNQLSGGQMQRVSIARALINNPSIILADEPTGALDSNTSVQIMEILKEISYNKLIIMVTHNPELAEQYSNRIVRLKDGLVVDDTNPYYSEKEKAHVEKEENVEESLTTDEATAQEQEQAEKKLDSAVGQEGVAEEEGGKKKKKVKIAKIDFSKHKAKKQRKNLLKKTSMSFASAIKLSFTNLMTKKGRTFMTAFAGSIGIIGVALVLAISNGFSAYINNMQKTMLSGYPIAITSSATSMESMMGTYMQMLNPDKEKYPVDEKVYSYNLLSLLGDMIHENDLSDEYMAYFDEKRAVWEENELVDSVYYNYGYSYTVFNKNKDDVGKMIGANFKTVNWQELVGGQSYIESSYDVIGGRYPSSATELVLIVDNTNSVMSLYLEGMGLASNAVVSGDVSFERILGNGNSRKPVSFLIPNSKAKYKEAVNEKTGNKYYVERSYDEIEKMYNDGDANVYKAEIVGILRPKEGKDYTPIMPGVAYTQELTKLMRSDAKDSDVAKLQKEVEYNPLSGDEYDTSSIDFSNMDLNNIMNIMNGASTAMTKKVVSQMIGVSSTPSAINIYASDFDNKDLILKDLDAWNKANESNTKAQVKYTDSAAIMITMISQMIRIITIALVCFSSVSLVVSSIMIGIITYVSVVERTKEIGILRSLGARKRDVSNIFNAETFIIGLAAGAIGVLVTYLLSIPINLVINHLLDSMVTNICMLHPLHALLMICLSVILTLIAGIVPSRAAAKKDPVIALRTD
ncbi:MAG: ABC transporter ATP-binding protein/permease [Clostridia bacterium]|nr:ABC transporter ATP-binding protein/permease [Clostridia bacterium]